MKRLFLILSLSSFTIAQSLAAGPVDLKSIHNILIAGDSITHHSPVPELNWSGDWGMAATAADKDYVHLFLAKLAQARGPGVPAPNVWISGEGGGKITDQLKFAAKITAYHADLALVQLGENDRTPTVAAFQQPYEQLLAAIRAGNPNAIILCSGVWGIWPTGDHTKDNMIRTACQKYGAIYADLGDAYVDPQNQAKSEHLFTNPGVNWHPSDGGMAAYADAFWTALTGASASPAPAAVEGAQPAAASAPATTAPATTADAGAPVEADETWGSPTNFSWTPFPKIVQDNGKKVAQISASTSAGAKCSATLDITQFVGRELTIHTRVKADSVSEPPKPWNGIKLTLRTENAEGKIEYPDTRFPGGTFDWKEVNWKVRIPDNIISLDLIIGLEDASGTVSYDGIQISAGK